MYIYIYIYIYIKNSVSKLGNLERTYFLNVTSHKIDVLGNFKKFTRKHACQCLFNFIKK